MQHRRKFPKLFLSLAVLVLAGVAFVWWKEIPAPKEHKEVALPASQFLQ